MKSPPFSAPKDVTQTEDGPKPPLSSPVVLNKTQWTSIAKDTILALISGPTTLVAAGCAFYTTLALFPSISILISIYGLAFDVQSVATQLNVIRNLLPPAAFSIIADRVQLLVSEPPGALTINLLISTLIALWSASAGMKSVLSALNIVYEIEETRSFITFQLLALGMTLGATVGMCLSVATLVAIPAMLDYLPIILQIDPPAGSIDVAVRMSGIAVVTLFMTGAFMVLYRFGPSRTDSVQWRWLAPGAIAATVVWIIAATGFSYYVAHVASYSSTYGPLGAVVAMMMWFFVSVCVVLMGAEFNAELETTANLPGSKPLRPEK